MFCTKKTTQSWFLPPPKKNQKPDSFLAQQLFGICTYRVGNNNFLAKNWGPHATESYFFLCISGFDAIICYLNLWGALKCARHDAVQTHHLLVLREDVETRTHPELLSNPEMPRLDAMRQGSESPKRHCAFGTLAFERLPQMRKKGPWVFRRFVGDEIRPMLCGDYLKKPYYKDPGIK